jgi:Tol biopolymer transport system component
LAVRGGLVVAVSLLALTVGAQRSDARSGGTSGGRIIFIAGESGDVGPSPNLYMTNADGTNAQVPRPWASYAVFAPSGRYLAYQVISEKNTRVMAAEGPSRDRLLIRNAWFADWAPVGGSIAFERGSDVWVKSLRGGAERRVARNADVPAWLPDGKRLAVRRGSDSRGFGGDIWVLDLTAKTEKRVIRDACDAHWSPDGRKVAFARCDEVESFIYVARADGSAARRLVKGESPAWSPNSREIAYTDGRRIFRRRADGTHWRVVWGDTQVYRACRFLDWAR